MLEKTQSWDDVNTAANSNEKGKKKSRMRKRGKQEATQGDSRTTQKDSREQTSKELDQKSSQPQVTVSAKRKTAEEEITQPSEKPPQEFLVPIVSKMRSNDRITETQPKGGMKRQRPKEPMPYSIGSGKEGWRRKMAGDKRSEKTQQSTNASLNNGDKGRMCISAEGVKWLGIDWSWLFTGCLASAAFSPAQIELLAEYTRFYGGFYFFALFLLMLIAVQLPLTFLLIHCAQFTQTGITTTAPSFGKMYRALGFGMLCYCVLNQGLLVHEVSLRVDYAISVSSHLDAVVDCKFRDMVVTTLMTVSTLCIWIMVIGTPGEALLRLLTLSQPQRLFSVGVFSALFDLVLAPIGLNFSIISMASFRARRSDSFTISCVLSLIHTAVFVMFFMANNSMSSIVEKKGARELRATSIPSSRQEGNKMQWNDEYWKHFLPEFMGVFGSSGLYIFFVITEFSIYFLSLIGPFFAVMVVIRDNDCHRRKITYRLSIGLLSGLVLLLAALLRHYPNVACQLHGPSLVGFFTVIFVLIVMRTYGKREFALDLCTMYPLTGTFRDHFGPFSPFLSWTLNTFTPFVLSVIMTARLFLKYDFDREKEEGFTFGAFLEMLLPTLPVILSSAILLFDIGRWFHHLRNPMKRRSMWLLVYPSNIHPSYHRILDEMGDEEEMKLHSKETVVSIDRLSQSQPQSSHNSQSAKNN